jgi:hypothetical protein
MKGPTTIDDFLALEEEGRRVARLRAPAREVRRFHAAVRRFATAWCTSPGRRIASLSSKAGVALSLELEDRYDWVAVATLHATHAKGEFFLKGPAPERAKLKLSTKVRKALDSLGKTWRALPGAEPCSELAVVVHLPKLADAGFDRFLETAVDAFEEL